MCGLREFTDGGPEHGPVTALISQLLDQARSAHSTGDRRLLEALTTAVVTLDPNNLEVEDLLVGTARRRQMTVLFCDIVESTVIADSLDPEDMGRIVQAYRAACQECIERYGGYTDEHKGDSMLVRFGYPDAQEDDAHRAVLCALAMIRSVSERNRQLRREFGIDLRIRVSVHTDLVVLGRSGVSGATASEAARLQTVAAPDTVVISDATEALVRPWFDLAPMGEAALRGITRQIKVFKVLKARPTGERTGNSGLTPFTGRGGELQRIIDLYRTHARGDLSPPPRLFGLLVTGPAGIGKTRLIREAARAAGAACLVCRCSRYQRSTSLYAVAPLLEAACGIGEDDDAWDRLAKIRDRLGVDPERGPDLPFLCTALGIPLSMVSPRSDVDPARLRDEALQVAAGLVRSRLAANSRSMLFVDDVQWADESSVDLITELITGSPPGSPILLAARSDFESPWGERRVDLLPLDAIAGEDLANLIDRMPESSALTPEQRLEIASRSDGIPLFVEELVRTAHAVAEGHITHRSVRYAHHQIPAALRDPLLSRLTAPHVDLELAQMAATVGRDVDLRLLGWLAGDDQAALQSRLQTLTAAGLIGLVEGRNARFRHELLREVAYETQSRDVLRERHSRIADYMLAQGELMSQSDAGEAASHLEGAQRYAEAIDVHIGAAQADQAVGAHGEAMRRLTRVLRLLAELPPGNESSRTELMVRQLRSFSAVMTNGYAAEEAAEDHRRCVQLCEELGMPPELLPSLVSSWSYYAFHGDLDAADDVALRMERVARQANLDFPAEEMGRGIVSFFRGRYTRALDILDEFARQPWGRTRGRPPAQWPLPNDPGACVDAHRFVTLWLCGDTSRAAQLERRACDRAATLDFPYGPFSLCYVTSVRAIVRRLQGDHAEAGRLGAEVLAWGERHGFLFWSITGRIQCALSAVHAGAAAALEEAVHLVESWRQHVVGEVWTPYLLTELAVVQRLAGRDEDALCSLEQALITASSTGSHFYTGETLRIRGELRRAQGDPRGVADLQRARLLTRRQGAEVLEARAVAALNGEPIG